MADVSAVNPNTTHPNGFDIIAFESHCQAILNIFTEAVPAFTIFVNSTMFALAFCTAEDVAIITPTKA